MARWDVIFSGLSKGLEQGFERADKKREMQLRMAQSKREQVSEDLSRLGAPAESIMLGRQLSKSPKAPMSAEDIQASEDYNRFLQRQAAIERKGTRAYELVPSSTLQRAIEHYDKQALIGELSEADKLEKEAMQDILRKRSGYAKPAAAAPSPKKEAAKEEKGGFMFFNPFQSFRKSLEKSRKTEGLPGLR